MFYIQHIHGRTYVTDLEDTRRKHEERMERYYTEQNERWMREHAARYRREQGGR